MLSLLQFLLAAVALSLLYIAIEATYNVFFHPLKDYPGPLLAKINKWHWTYLSWYGNAVKNTAELHEKYGEVVRIGPTRVSYIEAQAWQDIAGHRSPKGTGNLPKDERYRLQNANGISSIINADEENHRRLRRLQSHMFSEKALKEQEPLITSYIDMLISQLHRKASSPETDIVNIVRWFNYTTFDILGDLAFGDSFGSLASDTLHPWVTNVFFQIKEGIYYQIVKPFSTPIFKFMMCMRPRATKGAKKSGFNFASMKARERVLQGDTDRADFMSYILKYNDEKGMSLGEIESSASLLIIAGSETTATVLSGLTYLLLQTPTALQTLTSLIRTTFAAETDINMIAVQQLEYVNACVEEGLRLYPPAPAGFPRLVPEGGAMICDRFVPPLTTVHVSIHAANTSARNFADPHQFVPERWLKNAPARYENDNKKAMQTFSFGPRNCIGRNLAYAEVRLILTRLLWNFDLELQNDCLNWSEQKVWGVWEKTPLHVKLIPRVS